MTENTKDPLGGELSIEARIDESGVKAGARSRALVALDRLCGSLIDIPGAYLEGIAQRARARDRVHSELIAAEGETAKQKLLNDPSTGDRVIDVFLSNQRRRQDNRDAVVQETLSSLKALPPPSRDEEIANDSRSMEEDWLNVFEKHAENASSDRLREMWGRILAGEIRKPGSFSLTTLRVIAELDREIAEGFEKAVKTRMAPGVLPKPPDLVGTALMELTFLEEVGLLQDVSGFLGMDLTVAPDGHAHLPNGERYFLRVKTKPGQSLRINFIKLTRVGKEIASILPEEREDIALRAVAEGLSAKVESMQLCTVVRRQPNG